MNEESEQNRISLFACVMDAIEHSKRDGHIATTSYLFHRVTEIQELENGYRFRLSGDVGLLSRLGEFIELEKLCCPFFGFTLDVEPEGGAVWLKLTGREGVKPFIRAEIGEFLTGIKF